MISSKLNKFFSRKIVIAVISLILAVAAWVAVVMTVSPNMTRTIVDIPVTMPKSGAGYQTLGLDVVSPDLDSYVVSVVVEGDRNIVGALTASSFTVQPITTNVTSAGTYELILAVIDNPTLFNSYSIKSILPASITLTFGNVTTQSYPVEIVQTSPLTAPEGYLLHTITASPSSVRITATEAALSRIARVVARVDGNRVLTQSEVVSKHIILLDAEGNELNVSEYKLDTSVVDVTVPVYKYAELPLLVEFVNVPEGFDESSIEYILSQQTLRVAATETVLESLRSLTVARINLAQFSFGQEYSFDISLGSGILNLDNVDKVTVTLPQGNLTTKKISVTTIRFEHGSDQYDYTLNTQRINSVQLIGPKSELLALPASAVAAIVDLSSIALESGENTVAVTFIVPGHPDVWVIGEYSVIVQVQPK